MAKIRTRHITVKGKIDETYKVDIFYGTLEKSYRHSGKTHFYIVLPSKYLEALEGLKKEQKEKLHIIERMTSRSRRINRLTSESVPNKEFLVCGDNEKQVAENFETAVNEVSRASFKERKVIFLYFTQEGESDTYVNWDYNKEHQIIGATLAIGYGTEVKVVGGKERFYTKKYNDQKNSVHVSEYSDRLPFVLLDDTPENRIGLERLYGMYKKLIQELKKYCASERDILKLISRKQPLLTFLDENSKTVVVKPGKGSVNISL